MQRGQLVATHAAVVALDKLRRELPPLPGLRDFRCIFHAHAEDSTHTGGTRPEMLADAKRARVSAIFLSDHYRPPRDFMDSWRGLTNGVLFIPGSEVRGFLVHPTNSIRTRMDAPVPEFVAAATAGEGLALLSHIEERPDHPMAGLTGLEIYNRHYDAKRDFLGVLALAMRLTDPVELAELTDLLKLYPDELLAAQVEYPAAYLEKWDAETRTRRLVGVAANDCHHNQVFVVKVMDANTVRLGTLVDKDESMRVITAALRPGVRQLTEGRQPGELAARLDFDPYHRAFRDVSTHVFATELTEPTLRAAVKAGHAYVSHDWMADPTGFTCQAGAAMMGDEVRRETGLTLTARFPLPCHIRLFRDGKEVAKAQGDTFEYSLDMAGVYRLEAWLEIGGEERPWIYANPIYVR